METDSHIVIQAKNTRVVETNVQKTIWKQKIINDRMSASHKLIALVIATKMNQTTFKTEPLIETLMVNCSLSKITIIKATLYLAERGWLRKTKRPGKSNTYELTLKDSNRNEQAA